MTLQLDPERGEVIKDFLMYEIDGMIGADGIEAEKKKLRQQGVDEAVLEDELCARMMPAVFLKGNYKVVEELAKTDPEAAEDLRKVIGSIREHLAEEYAKFTNPDEYQNIVDNILKDENFKIDETYVEVADKIPSDLCKILGIENGRLAIRFTKLYAVIREDGNLKLKKGKKPNYHNLGENFAKNVSSYLSDPDVVILLGGGEYNVVKKMGDGKTYVTSLRLQKNLKIGGENADYNLIVTAFETDPGYVDSKRINKKNRVIYKKSDTTQVSERARYVPNAINAVSLNNSISNSYENVNSDFYQSMKDLVSKETTELYDRLTEALDKHYGIQQAVGATFVPPRWQKWQK